MGDDGMLMNFDVADVGPVPARPNFKGGRWTDRVKAKRAIQHYEKKKAAVASGEVTADGGSKPERIRSQAEAFNNAQNAVRAQYRRDKDGHMRRVGGPAPGSYPVIAGAAGERMELKRKRDNGGAGGEDTVMEDGAQHSELPPPRSRARADAGQGAATVEKGQFVSSLWTYNPTGEDGNEKPVAEEEEEEAAQVPSNAPLSDGSAFTTLGLSPILATHLVDKLMMKAPTAIQKAAIPDLITTDSDAFIQAQTGSGKTLTYLLPILHRIMSLTPPRAGPGGIMLGRTMGLYAIIMAPTRELSQQIMKVLTTLSHAKNGPHWIVSGCVTGGEKKKSEKARLRKGMNILVATPGRLLDHLENTESLDVSRLRWLVLDEGDRLMELGFEETISKILAILEKRGRVGTGRGHGEGQLPKRRVTMLCSATMKTTVQKLGDISLKEALFIKDDSNTNKDGDGDTSMAASGEEQFIAPAQLRQAYIVVPAKQRLVALYAVLKRAFMRQSANIKVIVFFSCADSVDFHFEVFTRKLQEDQDIAAAQERKRKEEAAKQHRSGGLLGVPDEKKKKNRKPRKIKGEDDDEEDDSSASDDGSENEDDDEDSEESEEDDKPKTPVTKKKTPPPNPAVRPAPLLHPTLILHKLHGTLPQPIRTATLHSFVSTPKPTPGNPTPVNSAPSLLFCTDVASRGLDLPNLDLVTQFDPPFSRDDYLHRIGRTARAGREGRATIFLLPGAEEKYVEKVIIPSTTPPTTTVDEDGNPTPSLTLNPVKKMDLNEVLARGFLPPPPPASSTGGKKQHKLSAHAQKQLYENLATEFQLSIENWLLTPTFTTSLNTHTNMTQQVSTTNPHLLLAKKAWSSHIRAYTTHPTSEKSIFPLPQLHVGHLAKAFGLRDKPGDIHIPGLNAGSSPAANAKAKAGKNSNVAKERSNNLLTASGGGGGAGDERKKRVWDPEDMVGVGGNVDEGEAARRLWRLAKSMQGKKAQSGEFNIG
ncbi:ATP-dependent RNA helicase-like protein dbp7 [Peziza echinospora]|nr:ATP-dependent RNA helicase-like protein dbp7 [Peziza echinospora]